MKVVFLSTSPIVWLPSQLFCQEARYKPVKKRDIDISRFKKFVGFPQRLDTFVPISPNLISCGTAFGIHEVEGK